MIRASVVGKVDGPLNPYRRQFAPGYVTYLQTPDGGWRRRRLGRGYRTRLHPGHGALLTALAAETGLELVWATAWEHAANARVAPAIGLAPLPVIEFPPADARYDEKGRLVWRVGGGWKWPAVCDYAAGRPLAWLDDQHDHADYRSGRIAFDRDREGAPTLLCHVDPRHGLRSVHLDRIRAWAAALPAA